MIVQTTKNAVAEAAEECRDAFYRFFQHLDRSEAAKAAGFFSADGVWERQGAFVKGVAEIEKAIAGRAPDLVTRHHFSNMTITLTSPTTAEGLAYYAVYSGRTSDPPGAIAPQRVGDYASKYTLVDGVWKLSFCSAKRVFQS